MKIQPIEEDFPVNGGVERVHKSRLKRLLDRPFTNVLKSSVTGEAQTVLEPSSVVLAKMVQNYMEENNNNEKQTKFGRNRCNCFNGNNDSSDDEFDTSDDDYYFKFKSLNPCESISERSLLADVTKIVEKNKWVNRKDELKKMVMDGLSFLGYHTSICKSKWHKTRSVPAGEYEYIDVIVNGERFLIDVDFRSEFEIARQTNAYKALLQALPFIFVGKSARIRQIVAIVSEAAKQSLKKKGMPFPPWRRADYMRAKWLSSYTRLPPSVTSAVVAEPELSFEEKFLSSSLDGNGKDGDDVAQPVERETKVLVTGLASLFKLNP